MRRTRPSAPGLIKTVAGIVWARFGCAEPGPDSAVMLQIWPREPDPFFPRSGVEHDAEGLADALVGLELLADERSGLGGRQDARH